jgi:N-acetylated-alpha-linked acidic dipeptidase
MKKLLAAIAVGTVFAACAIFAQQAAVAPQSVGDQIDIAEIDRTLKAIDVDRTSGHEGERQSAAHLEQKLKEYGVHYARHDMKAYLSWPKRASVSASGSSATVFRAVTPAFSASTGPSGVTADLFFLPPKRGSDDPGPLPPEARGKIVVAPGMIAPESVLRAQQAGAVGVIHVNDNDILHEMIATTIWGTPGASEVDRLPRLPVASITQTDGRSLRQLASSGAKIRIETELDQGWTTIPLVVADVPGATDDFVLVATHLDAWYHGMTDTAGTVASILDMSRVLQKHRSELVRGVRFAWWPGHSFGRYPGSTWYVDHFWGDLDRHGVAYTNLDGSGRRGSRMDAVTAGGWPGIAEFSRDFAEKLTGKSVSARSRDAGLFRPGRDSDSAFQGIGVPEFTIGVPGPGRGHPDVEAGGEITYWHTANDTYDKLDLKALELDTKYRVAEIYALATTPILPLRIAPIAQSYVQALDELSKDSGTAFDLSTTRRAAEALAASAARFDAQAPPTSPAAVAARNRLLVEVTHELNSRLYTGAGRFRQDPAAETPILPLIAPAADLAKMAKDSNAFGFLEADLIRGRNAVEATLRDATEALDGHRVNSQ